SLALPPRTFSRLPTSPRPCGPPTYCSNRRLMGVRPTILEPIFHLVHKSTQRRHGQQLVQRCEYCRTALGPSTHYCVNSFGCVDNRIGSGSYVSRTCGKSSVQPTTSRQHRSNYCALSYAAICCCSIAYFNLCNPPALVSSRRLYFS